MSKDDRTPLTYEQAVEMIPDTANIHTFRSNPMALIGCDWSIEEILKALKTGKPELAGEQATAMNHGLVIFDEYGPLFIATKETK
jgi:hypothetical protein